MFEFIEVGTSDFESLAIDLPNKKGLLIEPIKQYLDNLPNNINHIKANYALTDRGGETKVFYVKPEDIIKYNLPNWVRGCNSINEPHPTVKELLGSNHDNIISIDIIKCITWENLIEEFNIESIDYLKIDTENNVLSNKDEVLDVINEFKLLGYIGEDKFGENYELKK